MRLVAAVIFFITLSLPVLRASGETEAHDALVRATSPKQKATETLEAKVQSTTGSVEPVKETVRRVYLMGTLCTIQMDSLDAKEALKHIESLIIELEKAEEELSTWKETSILSQLNRQPVGVPLKVERSVWRLFKTLRSYSVSTGHAFDPTVGKLLNAYGSRTGGKWPDHNEIDEAKAHRGMHFYSLDGSGRRITKTGDIEIDCGAFGKGEALDRLLKEDVGNSRWLVNLGGQVLVNGPAPDDDGWPVSIAHPQNRQDSLFVIKMRNGSLATSGGSERDVEVEKRRLGHIINPNTGRPAEFGGSVSVWHRRALVADILSTAFYVMGPEKGLAWAESRNIAVCFLIPDENGKVTALFSSAFEDQFLGSNGRRLIQKRPLKTMDNNRLRIPGGAENLEVFPNVRWRQYSARSREIPIKPMP